MNTHLTTDLESTFTYPERPDVEEILNRPTLATESYRLWGFAETIEQPVISRLFGELVKRATPVVEHYHSDLYHDANWLTGHVTGPCEFLWMARQSGTEIGEIVKVYMSVNMEPSSPAIAYRVSLLCERGEWTVRFDTLDYGSARRG